MALLPGARLGPYEITGALGAGGMGEVYRAHDTRLKRDVAIKVLPASVAQDADRLRRFEQEALATAALNHPNILVVYDIEQHDSASRSGVFIVTELLEGRTLREVIDEAAVPLRKAVDYASQIAQGIAAAHGKSIVHRDLKPENLFVTTEDRVKILDFGISKVTDTATFSGATSTVLSPRTEPGVVVGTIGYMAPEQIRGLNIDHRADIFSFGAVLYELLSGRRAFSGATAADTMTAILKEAPADLAASGRAVPVALARVVERCLEKLPAARFQSASDLAFALQALGSATGSGSAIAPVLPAPRSASATRMWIAAAAALAIGAAIGATGWRAFVPAPPPPSFVTLDVTVAQGYRLEPGSALSPDGSNLVFVAEDAQSRRSLWLRVLATGESRQLDDTEEATSPFWSPNGEFIGYFTLNRLRVIHLATGRTQSICDVKGARKAGSWNQHGVIIFAAETALPIMKVQADGRTPPEALEGIEGFRPFFLPDGRHFLLAKPAAEGGGRGINVINLETREATSLLPTSGTGDDTSPLEGSEPKYVDGYLLFVVRNELLAQPFDPVSRTLSGDATVLASVGPHTGSVGMNFSVSANGLIAFARVPVVTRELASYTRAGARTSIDEPGSWRNLDLSPDDTQLAGERFETSNQRSDIWLHDVRRGTSRLLVSGTARGAFQPMWSSDSKRLRYGRLAGAAVGVAEITIEDRSERMLREVSRNRMGTLTGVAKDDGFLEFFITDGQRDIGYWAPDAKERVVIAGSPADENQPMLSPNERWLAYTSNADGNADRVVIVADFPRAERKMRIGGSKGSTQPRWRKDGRELFYIAPGGDMVAVAVEEVGAEMRLGSPRVLFNTRLPSEGGLGTRGHYDVTRDGSRFIVAEPRESVKGRAVTVLVNWKSKL